MNEARSPPSSVLRPDRVFAAAAVSRSQAAAKFLRIGSLGFLGLGLDEWFRLRAMAGSKSGEPAKVKNCILIWLAGGPSHIDTFDPEAGGGRRRSRRIQADRHSRSRAANQRGFPQPGQGHGSRDLDSEHDLARGRSRPGRPSHVDGLSPVAGPGVSGLRERGVQGSRGDAGDAASLCRGSRRPDLRLERLSDAGLRPVLGLRRSQSGELPGAEPDAARPADARAAPAAPGDGQKA